MELFKVLTRDEAHLGDLKRAREFHSLIHGVCLSPMCSKKVDADLDLTDHEIPHCLGWVHNSELIFPEFFFDITKRHRPLVSI